MTQLKLPDEAKAELTREREDWLAIFGAYMRSEQEGREMFAGKHERCGLCPKYKVSKTEGDHTYLSCRECPIVILTGNTCYYAFRHYGKFDLTNEDRPPYEGMRIAWTTYKFLDELIGGI